jgi:M6 family metalloprotease-like protein
MKKLLSLLFISMICFQLFAVPANSDPVTVIQPNGDEITLIMRGDEFINWAETLDGYTLLVNSENYWCYAQLNSSGDLEPSSYIAADFLYRTQEVTAWLHQIDKKLFYSKEQVSYYMQLREMVDAEYAKNMIEPKGERKLLVILMNFTDRTFIKTAEDFDMLLNQINYKESGNWGSMRDFYLETSYNKFEVQCTVIGPYTTPGPMSVYKDNGTLFAKTAIKAAYEDGFNLAPFAVNNEIPSFYAIYAGYDHSQGCSTCIHAHAGYILPAVTYNGIKISRYACSSELRNNSGTTLSSVAVFCHEFGHSLGAPDYYDIDYEENGQYDGTGKWDLMGEGTNINVTCTGCIPPTHNPRSKIYTYNWAQVIELDYPQKVTIPAGRIYPNAYFRITGPVMSINQQYLLIENKIKEGFDTGIPGQNLLIYKCTESYESSATYKQNTTSWQRFYPISANATIDVPEAGTNKKSQYGNIGNTSCTWPGTNNKTTFDDETIPGMITWAKVPYNKPITNITVHGDYITFDFMGGGEKSNCHVFLPAYKGCVASAMPGSTSPVEKGNSFSFKVDLLPHFFASEIKVTVNHNALIPSGNVYTISNILEDQIVRIEIKDLTYNSVKDITDGAEDKIIVYPNPTTGKLTIDMFDIRYEICDIVIYDVFGRTQKIENHLSQIGKSQIEINISHLPTGIYFLRIQTDAGMITKKVVKE